MVCENINASFPRTNIVVWMNRVNPFVLKIERNTSITVKKICSDSASTFSRDHFFQADHVHLVCSILPKFLVSEVLVNFVTLIK